jgi:hypothetical protein
MSPCKNDVHVCVIIFAYNKGVMHGSFKQIEQILFALFTQIKSLTNMWRFKTDVLDFQHRHKYKQTMKEGWHQMLRKGNHDLFHSWHPSYYVKGPMKSHGGGFAKREHLRCHLWQKHSVTVSMIYIQHKSDDK